MVCVSASAKLLVVGWVLLMWIKEGNAQELTLGTLACPRSATANTGCYCTNGCAVQGDRPFPWQAPAFPPTPLDASYVGSDTICAKITFPITPDVASVNLATYLGVQGRQTASQAPFVATANYTEVTVWTALSASQCSNVVTLASAVVKAIPSASGLYVNFCTTNLCNGVNLPALPAPTTAATTTGVRFPGACPVANVEPTGCYCTVGCGVNGDPSFPWSAAKWPPVALGASVVGSDTICAKITFPIVNTAAGLDFAAYLGVTGDVLRTGSNYFGAAVGETVTVYTAFTTQECKNFVSLAKSLASTTAVNTGMVLCNTTNCNSITSGNPGSGAVSSARGGVVVGMLLCGMLAFLVVGFA